MALTECALLAVKSAVLVNLRVQLLLLDALVLSEEVSRAHEVLQVIASDSVLQLETLNLWLADHVVSDDTAHASRPRSSKAEFSNEFIVL